MFIYYYVSVLSSCSYVSAVSLCWSTPAVMVENRDIPLCSIKQPRISRSGRGDSLIDRFYNLVRTNELQLSMLRRRVTLRRVRKGLSRQHLGSLNTIPFEPKIQPCQRWITFIPYEWKSNSVLSFFASSRYSNIFYLQV